MGTYRRLSRILAIPHISQLVRTMGTQHARVVIPFIFPHILTGCMEQNESDHDGQEIIFDRVLGGANVSRLGL